MPATDTQITAWHTLNRLMGSLPFYVDYQQEL